jgi:Domain of unknown function (DUF6265)
MFQLTMQCVVWALMATCPTQSAPQDFKQLDWLVGNWRGQSQGANFYESWERVSATELSNLNYSLCNGQAVVAERGAIRLAGNQITMGGEKDQWRLTRLTGNEAVFENPDIAYARKITHRLTPEGNWHARIEHQNGVLEYTLTRVAPLAELTKQKPQFIRGRFTGTGASPERTVQLIANFSAQDGQPRLLVSSPERQIKDVPALRLCYDASQLKFALSDGAQEIEFIAELNGDEIIGKATNNRTPVTLRLRREPAVKPK